jgi:uncharacterized membrane protein
MYVAVVGSDEGALMLALALAVLLFVGSHLLLSAPRLRNVLVGQLGEGMFRGLYVVVALITITLVVMAWRRAPFVPILEPGPGLRHLSLLVMPLAFILLVGALTGRNPTALGQRVGDGDPATGFLRITRHPLMWAIALWGIVHVLANGDAAAVLLFGGLAFLALFGTVQQDRKLAARPDPRWQEFLAVTSHVPFAAILARRQRLVPAEIGWWRPLLGLVMFVVVLLAHPWLFGVAVLG